MNIVKRIDQTIGEVRTESVDLSFGEIANLRRNNELIIQPEYQRLFRWSITQKSRLIESILIELPIPQVFVIERENGVYELIDGLQRISTVLQFIEPAIINEESLRLDDCDIITELNGNTFETLPLSLKLRIKRSTLRTIVIKRQSKSFLRYEMFKRLNTGGSQLSAQEIRNCSARMIGNEGAEFYSFLVELANSDSFRSTISTLAEADVEQKADEELVLRFFAAKQARNIYKGNIRDWLDNFMEGVLLEKIVFDITSGKRTFLELFGLINEKLGETAFVKYRGDNPIGGLAPAYFEAIAIGCLEAYSELLAKPKKRIKSAIIELVQSQPFRQVTGPGANNKTKLESRIRLATDAIKKA